MLKLIHVFLVISAFIFTLSSCKHYKVDGTKIDSDRSNYSATYFNTAQKAYFYTADISVFKNNLSGVLVVKKMENGSKRLALLSDFGNTFIDLEFVNNEVNVVYILDDLNKKIIVKKLNKYFQLLVHSEYEIKNTYVVNEKKTLISKLQGKRVFLDLNKENRLTKLTQSSIFRDKVGIQYYGDSHYADSILFESYELPIKIFLEKTN